MRISVQCDGCDAPMLLDDLRMHDGGPTCLDCYTWEADWDEEEHPDDPSVQWHDLPPLPPILAMEPGPPPERAPPDTEWIVLWFDRGRMGSEIVPGWLLRTVSRKDRVEGPYAMYHVQLPGGQDE